MSVPFVGPSYQLKRKKADVQRSVNLHVSNIESGQGKSRQFLKSIPGLSEFSAVPAPVPPPPDPPVVFFTAACSVPIEFDTAHTLSWTVTGADTVSISPTIGAVGDTGTVSATAGVTYTLTATGPGGTTVVDCTPEVVYTNYESYDGMPIYTGGTPDDVAQLVGEWYCTTVQLSSLSSIHWASEFTLVNAICANTAVSSVILIYPACPATE